MHNEDQLIKQVVLGDERAFTELFDGYYKKLGQYIFKFTDSIEVTEEIVQDVFIKIWLNRMKLADVKNFSHYLFILSRNQTISFLRKKATQANQHGEWEKEQAADYSLTDEVNLTEQLRLKIEHAIALLPPQQQKVFVLSKYERLKYEEIAHKLNISPETVKKHLQAAVKALKNQVNEKGNPVIVAILLSPLWIK
ncbi:RNA polymerase sigma factor [Pedobacter sp. AW31-3R]|uniref:RNA polymerase sigma factor n=1 Tax=Pedobacter sp. AW31-3R TaxID=3445781 RepID=UPI003FA19541